MNNPSLRRSWLRAACFALALAPLVGAAQIAPAAKDPLVRSIRIKTDGTAVSEQFVLRFVALRQAQPFSKDAAPSTAPPLSAPAPPPPARGRSGRWAADTQVS